LGAGAAALPRLAWAPFALCVVGYADMVRTIWTLYGLGR
jgi:hypothetical protein